MPKMSNQERRSWYYLTLYIQLVLSIPEVPRLGEAGPGGLLQPGGEAAQPRQPEDGVNGVSLDGGVPGQQPGLGLGLDGGHVRHGGHAQLQPAHAAQVDGGARRDRRHARGEAHHLSRGLELRLEPNKSQFVQIRAYIQSSVLVRRYKILHDTFRLLCADSYLLFLQWILVVAGGCYTKSTDHSLSITMSSLSLQPGHCASPPPPASSRTRAAPTNGSAGPARGGAADQSAVAAAAAAPEIKCGEN